MSAAHQRRLDPFGVGALVAAGTLAAHQIGYLVDPTARAAHTYLAVVGPAVLLVAFLAAWTAAVRILRRDGGRAPSVARLATMQVALYLVMEFTERLAGDSFGSMWSMPVALGLVAQPVVAWTALRMIRMGGRVLERLAGPVCAADTPSVVLRPGAPVVLHLVAPRATIRLRGPPLA